MIYRLLPTAERGVIRADWLIPLIRVRVPRFWSGDSFCANYVISAHETQIGGRRYMTITRNKSTRNAPYSYFAPVIPGNLKCTVEDFRWCFDQGDCRARFSDRITPDIMHWKTRAFVPIVSLLTSVTASNVVGFDNLVNVTPCVIAQAKFVQN